MKYICLKGYKTTMGKKLYSSSIKRHVANILKGLSNKIIYKMHVGFFPSNFW